MTSKLCHNTSQHVIIQAYVFPTPTRSTEPCQLNFPLDKDNLRENEAWFKQKPVISGKKFWPEDIGRKLDAKLPVTNGKCLMLMCTWK